MADRRPDPGLTESEVRKWHKSLWPGSVFTPERPKGTTDAHWCGVLDNIAKMNAEIWAKWPEDHKLILRRFETRPHRACPTCRCNDSELVKTIRSAW